MSTFSPDVRFGIWVDGRRSRCYRVRSGAVQPELFVEREGLAKAAHISLHASGQWYLRVKGGGVAHQWLRPPEFAAGYTRALSIIQPPSVATVPLDEAGDIQLIEMEIDSEPAHFNIFY